MCLQCHMTMTTPEYNEQILKDCLQNPNFQEWNTTSFAHILLSIRGLDGPICHQLASELIEKFYKWYLGKTNGYWEYFGKYYPPQGLTSFIPIKRTREMIDDAYIFYDIYKNENKTREELARIIDKEFSIKYGDDYDRIYDTNSQTDQSVD